MSIRYFLLLLSVVSIQVTMRGQGLTGLKTIGGSSPDYPTILSAVNELNSEGVGIGGVQFQIRPGTYSESFTITTDGSPSNPILFTSEYLDASSVIIQANSEVVILEGAHSIQFKFLSFDHLGTSGNTIEIKDKTTDILFESCLVDGCSTTGTLFGNAAIYLSETTALSSCDSIQIKNCEINSGSWGIYYNQLLSTSGSCSISSTNFTNQTAGAIDVSGFANLEIINNSVVASQSSNTNYKGFYVDGCTGNLLIHANYIYTSGNGRIAYGIHLNDASGLANNYARLENNSIQVQNENSICYALFQSNNSNKYRIASNTLYISGGTGSGSATFNTFVAASDLILLNNIFINNSSNSGVNANRCVYIANASGLQQADYNCYYTSNAGNPFAGYLGSSYSDFANYTSASNEVNSVNSDPMMTFIEGVGWKASSQALTGIGINFLEIPEDIDGFTRFEPTSIGAHELAIITDIQEENTSNSMNIWFGDQNLLIKSTLKSETLTKIEVYNYIGQIQFEYSGFLTPDVINILPYTPINTGVYFVICQQGEKQITKKLLKQSK